MQNLIGGNHTLTDELWALSLLREEGKEHAYLILEGIKDNHRVARQTHLTYKDRDRKATKAVIVHRDLMLDDVNENIKGLRTIAENCHSYTWSITKEQVATFEILVAEEVQRGENGQITYIVYGKAGISGTFGASLETIGSKPVQEASLQSVEKKLRDHTMSRDALRQLLVEGHNCYSWAESMVKSLGLVVPTDKWKKTFFCDPSEILQGNLRGENLVEDEPTTRSSCTLA